MYIDKLSKTLPSNISIDECMAVVKFCANQLFRPTMQRKLLVFLDFDNLKDNDISDGMCSVVEYNSRGPRVFSISLNKNLSRLHCIVNICHEMVHMHQYVFGKLKMKFEHEDDIDNIKWKGKKFVFKHPITAKMGQAGKLTKEELEAYYNLPWEKEANIKQFGLARKYLKTF